MIKIQIHVQNVIYLKETAMFFCIPTSNCKVCTRKGVLPPLAKKSTGLYVCIHRIRRVCVCIHTVLYIDP